MESVQDNIGDVSTTKRLPLLTAFVAVVHAGSFTRAAGRTGVDKSLLSRRVKALEDSLGVQLLHRTTRKLRVTHAGRVLFDRVVGGLGEVQEALAEVAAPGPVAGVVQVASVPSLAPAVLIPAIAALRRDHPDLLVDLQCTESFVNLVEGGFDLAIRAGNLPDSGLISRKLGTFGYVLCATPAWAAAHPDLETPADLADHWVLHGSVPNATRWSLVRGDTGLKIQVGSVLTVDNGQVQRDALRAGLGVAPLGTPLSAPLLASGELVRVLPEWRVEGRYGIYGVTPHRTHVPARVQAALTAMGRQLGAIQDDWDALVA